MLNRFPINGVTLNGTRSSAYVPWEGTGVVEMAGELDGSVIIPVSLVAAAAQSESFAIFTRVRRGEGEALLATQSSATAGVVRAFNGVGEILSFLSGSGFTSSPPLPMAGELSAALSSTGTFYKAKPLTGTLVLALSGLMRVEVSYGFGGDTQQFFASPRERVFTRGVLRRDFQAAPRARSFWRGLFERLFRRT